jgi:hypothetical protein
VEDQESMADSSSQQPSLTVLGGPMAGQRLALDESVANLLIGSDPSCDFYLPHDSVSPIHARLWMDLDGAVLHETSSPHGVYVNDDRVQGKRPLHNGDIIWLGPPGGANVVMIQCVLAESAGDEAAPAAAPGDDAQAEREALEALEPTLAARPALIAEEPAANAAPVWDPEADVVEPPPLPAAPRAPEVEESVRTQAFRLPADFAARLASPPPDPPAVPQEAATGDLDGLLADAPPAPAPVDVMDAPEPALPESAHEVVAEETLMDPAAYAPEPAVAADQPEPTLLGHDPTLVAHDPVVAEPEVYAAEPEPEIVEPVLPEPEPTVMEALPPVEPTLVAADPAALASDFDDMVFSVPDEAPAAAPGAPTAAASPAVEDAEQETVLLPAVPRPAAAAPPAPPAAPPAPPPPPAAAARPRPGAAAAAAATAAAPATRPAATPRAAASPRPAAARPQPRAAEPPAAHGSKGLPVAAIAAGVVLVVVAAGGAYWVLGRPATSATAGTVPPAPPATIAAAVTMPPAPPITAPPAVSADPVLPEPEPTVAPTEEMVTIVKTATPPPRPSAAPSAAATPRPADTRRPDPVDPAAAQRARIAAQVTALLGQANAAAAARNYDAALAQYDEVLRLDPQNAAAQAAKASVTAARAHARKAFVPGRTVVQTEKARGGGLEGFDSSGVNLQKAPDFQGRIEFAMSPASVQPGDPWQLKIYVVNEGKKAIKISSLAVTTMVNGSPSGSGGAPRNREIAPQQRVIVDELSGTWPAGVNSWKTEVKLTAGKNDTLASQLNWR